MVVTVDDVELYATRLYICKAILSELTLGDNILILEMKLLQICNYKHSACTTELPAILSGTFTRIDGVGEP